MKVLLAHGYFLADDPHEAELMRPFPPLGLQYLVGYLRREGVETEWWDATWQPGVAAFGSVLDSFRPTLVGFYGHTITRGVTAGMVAACKGRGLSVVAGGPDPVQYLDEYLAMGVDVVVIGEGEATLAELVAHLREHGGAWEFATLATVRGIAFRREDQIVRTPARPLIRPLDSLPWPMRERGDLEAYFEAWRRRHGQTAMSMTTSRGCPYHCTWCSKQVYGDSFRRREPDAVIDELLAIRREFSPDQVWFVDDMFTINRTWVDRFSARMVERDAVTPFYVIGRAETLEPGQLDRLKKAGLFRMYLSAESGADHVLDAMKKGTTVAELRRAGHMLREAGIEMGAFVMLGYPGETRPDVLATRDLLRDLDPAVTLVSVAHPMKGTAFYDGVSDKVTGQSGGRLTFEMAYSARFYNAAQKMLWADERRRRAQQAREARAFVGAAARYALWRGVMELG
ncbi:MAG: radical SAM protein [Myxococcales bacterium]|nr:radical SAM protein [Myxococcales bacterium]